MPPLLRCYQGPQLREESPGIADRCGRGCVVELLSHWDDFMEVQETTSWVSWGLCLTVFFLRTALCVKWTKQNENINIMRCAQISAMWCLCVTSLPFFHKIQNTFSTIYACCTAPPSIASCRPGGRRKVGKTNAEVECKISIDIL